MSWEMTPGMDPTPTRWFLLEKGKEGKGGGGGGESRFLCLWHVGNALRTLKAFDNGQPMSAKDSLSTFRCPYEKNAFLEIPVASV